MTPVADPIIIVVSRTDVERLRIAETLTKLREWIEGSLHPHDVRRRLQMAFHGYDRDARELWEIPEVRAFVLKLDQEFPYWFYLTDLRSEFLKVLVFCLCRVTSPIPGATAVHPQDFEAFLERHFGAMNQLLDHWCVSDAENESISNEIVTYFEQAKILN